MTGRDLIAKANQLREADNLLESLQTIEEALVILDKESSFQGFADALQVRVLTYKHLFYLSKNNLFALLAQKDAKASLQIAQEHSLNDFIYTCYFRLGEVFMLTNDYQKAAQNYQQALENFKATDCEKGDYTYHLGEALYLSGDKEKGKKKLFEGLKLIQDNSSQVDPFLAHVWESGAHMRIADLLKDVEPEVAEDHLQQAKQIIDSDPKLIIRKRQWEELVKKYANR